MIELIKQALTVACPYCGSFNIFGHLGWFECFDCDEEWSE